MVGLLQQKALGAPRVSDGLIYPILLAFFSLVGVWMLVSPEQYVVWIKMFALTLV
jgi:hypothetical protein